MKTLSIATIISIFLFSACAPVPQTYEPIIDKGNNFDYAQYWQDLKECQTYATKISPANQAAGEAFAGAGSGGLMGAAHGAGSAIERQKRIIENCMRGRGYKVLE